MSDKTKTTWDPRGFYRKTLAVIAPLPMVSMGVHYILNPLAGDVTVAETVEYDAANPGHLDALAWVATPFLLFLIPAFIAVGLVTWARAPKMTTVALALAVPGTALAFAANAPSESRLAFLVNDYGIDVDKLEAAITAWWEEPLVLIGSLLFMSGIVIGLLLLGLALWRTGAAPMWMGLALAIGGFTHPFIPGHVAQGVGLLVAAIGFAGASRALLKRTNDEFLPAPSA